MFSKKSALRLWFFIGLCVFANSSFAAVTQRQSAIQQGTTVRARTSATGLYSQECYDAYYGCMDQFCIPDNANGGSCACSDDSIEYEKQFAEIEEMFNEAERIRTEEVEKVKAGANADIVFTGERRYDSDGNLLGIGEETEEEAKAKARQDLLAVFNTNFYEEEDDVFSSISSIADLTGDDLYASAEELCLQQMPTGCDNDLTFIRQLYARQIVSDCNGFANIIKSKKSEAEAALASAEAEVRTALQESFDSANKYDLGTCMVEFKKCMLTDDACGEDWINCVSVVASENMQNNQAQSTAGTSVASADVYDITSSTMEILNSKRPICENVLSQCVAVRDQVWPAFLREAAPTIKVAESQAESKFRQSCLTEISDCIQTACRDDIAGKGVATMDACLSRPDMARSFCKVEIDPCERMEPLIWGYVVDKLAAMRVDACTQEVKDCFTNENRCGPNFENCIGMDYEYIHNICPIDSLVVCKANNPNFSMEDLDSMLMGLYLNIDNAMLDNCQNAVDKKMAEVCGSTTDCNRFASDDTIGTGSLRSQKDGDVYRVTGMISFGSIKMGDASGSVKDTINGEEVALKPGQIGVQDYIAKIREANKDVPDQASIITSIEEELNNIAGTINRTIEMISQDPEIQYCVSGRNLSQITGVAGQSTTARFPNLLNQVKMQIAIAALRQAQDNYNAKLNTAIADATKNASTDIAQYMCQMLPYTNGSTLGMTVSADTPLAEPYAISYEVGTGIDSAKLSQGAGHYSSSVSSSGGMSSAANSSQLSEVVNSFTGLGSNNVNVELPSGTREMWSVFNRETRICHYCTSVVTKDCSSLNKKGFLGIGNRSEMNCEESDPVETCRDIQM